MLEGWYLDELLWGSPELTLEVGHLPGLAIVYRLRTGSHGPVKYWVFPLKMVIFHSYVSLPEGTSYFQVSDCSRFLWGLICSILVLFCWCSSQCLGFSPFPLKNHRHIKSVWHTLTHNIYLSYAMLFYALLCYAIFSWPNPILSFFLSYLIFPILFILSESDPSYPFLSYLSFLIFLSCPS